MGPGALQRTMPVAAPTGDAGKVPNLYSGPSPAAAPIVCAATDDAGRPPDSGAAQVARHFGTLRFRRLLVTLSRARTRIGWATRGAKGGSRSSTSKNPRETANKW